MPNTRERRLRPRRIALIAALLGIIGCLSYVLISVAHLAGSDGTERLSAVERQVAEKAITSERRYSSIEPLPEAVRRIIATEVRTISPEERTAHCDGAALADPDDPRHYVVVLKIYKLFDQRARTTTVYGCELI